MSNKYFGLNRASISYEYLHTNSTTHEFLFGAIAELIDNARDAEAKQMRIDCPMDSNGDQLLTFLDDGCGMDRREAISVMTFGHSAKRLDPAMIGQYGNGLKSGAMRIGKDFVLFTKKNEVLTAVFLSRTFHDKERIQEVIVPCPSFTADEKVALIENDDDKIRHDMEMSIILKYSPFHTLPEFLAQFDRIVGESGTLVICFNLRRLENGELELDLRTDARDIRIMITGERHREVIEKESLRAYLAIIYAYPRMKVYIRDKKVETRRIVSSLYKQRQYKHLAKNFQARADKELQRSIHDAISAKERVQLAKSEVATFVTRHSNFATEQLLRINYRQLQNAVLMAEKMLADADRRQKNAQKSKNDPKPLVFVFGLNLDRRGDCGCMVYNNGRLIRMYEPVGPQKDGGIKCLGVIGVVDVPYIVLEPTHNKQSFADSKEYNALLRALGEHMEQYWSDIKLAATPGGVPKFWENYGYFSNDWSKLPNDDNACRIRRCMSVKMCVQCDDCLKWRSLEFQKKYVDNPIGDHWCCHMHPNAAFQQCSQPEAMEKIIEGKLIRSNSTTAVTVAVASTDVDEQLRRRTIRLAQQKLHGEHDIELVQSPRMSRDASQTTSSQQSLDETLDSSSQSNSSLRTRKPTTQSPTPSTLSTRSRMPPPIAHSTPARASTTTSNNHATIRVSPRKSPTKTRVAPVTTTTHHQHKVPDVRAKTKADLRRKAELARISKTKQSVTVASRPTAVVTTVGNGTEIARASKRRTSDRTDDREKSLSPEINSTISEKRSRLTKNETASSSSSSDNEPKYKIQSEKLAAIVRKFLIFNMPRDYIFNKEKVSAMSSDELIDVDIESFHRSYEAGLRKLLERDRDRTRQSQERCKQAEDMLLRCRLQMANWLDKANEPHSRNADSTINMNDVERRFDDLLDKS